MVNEPQFTMKKVFDCQDMPKEIKRAFFEYMEKGNDCYVALFIEEDLEEDELGEIPFFSKEYNRLIKWLLENGAEDGEEVLIRHWW